MQIQNTMLNLDSYPGTSCLSWWNGGLPLTSERAQEKTLNSEMGNCNRVTGVDSVSSHSRHDLELSDSNLHERCTSVQSGTNLMVLFIKNNCSTFLCCNFNIFYTSVGVMSISSLPGLSKIAWSYNNSFPVLTIEISLGIKY